MRTHGRTDGMIKRARGDYEDACLDVDVYDDMDKEEGGEENSCRGDEDSYEEGEEEEEEPASALLAIGMHRATTKATREGDGVITWHEKSQDRHHLASSMAMNRVTITRSAMTNMMTVLGESIQLPMKVMVDAPGEGMRQMVWLRSGGSLKMYMCFNEPLLSKIKSCPAKNRVWALGESGSDGIPCLKFSEREGGGRYWRRAPREGGREEPKPSLITTARGGGSEEEEEEDSFEEREEEEELRTSAPGLRVTANNSRDNRVSVSIATCTELFGSNFKLPMQVMFQVPSQGIRQLEWLRSWSYRQASLTFGNVSVLAKIRSYHGQYRKWSLGESGSDGVPCLVLDLLDAKRDDDGEEGGLNRARDEEEEEEEGGEKEGGEKEDTRQCT